MKLVLRYRGMSVRECTEMDVKKGNCPSYDLGTMVIHNEDGEEEYSGVGSIKEAKELIDGLHADRRWGNDE